jgi:hypothetical protein
MQHRQVNGCETKFWSVNANANDNVNAIWNEIEKKNFFYHMDDDLDRVELSYYEQC